MDQQTASFLSEIQSRGFRTSEAADTALTELARRIGFTKRYTLARLAIGVSLSDSSQPPPTSGSLGKTINAEDLFGIGEELVKWVSLIIEHAQLRTACSTQQFAELVERHWTRGQVILTGLYVTRDNPYSELEELLRKLAALVPNVESGPIADGPRALARPLLLRLGQPGTNLDSGETVEWPMNAPGMSPHFAAMGAPRTGKTRTAIDMWRQIRAMTPDTGFIVIDPKGDLAGKPETVAALGATVLNVPHDPIPVGLLQCLDGDNVTDAAQRFADSLAKAMEKDPGPIQKNVLRKALERTLSSGKPIDLAEIKSAVGKFCVEDKVKPGVLLATIDTLTARKLFAPNKTIADFARGRWIISFKDASPTVLRFVSFLLFDALFAWLKRQDDAPVDAHGNRALNVVLAIDEARELLGFGQRSLSSLIKMTASKGCSVQLISQSPDDFDTKVADFLEDVGMFIIFRTNAANTGTLKQMLAQPAQLSTIPTGVCLTRWGDMEHPVRVQAWAPAAGV